MTLEELNIIRAHMDDPTEKWNILTAQQDIKKLLGEVDRIRGRLSTCSFCGQRVAEGAGGHTSSCYERMLNEVKNDI